MSQPYRLSYEHVQLVEVDSERLWFGLEDFARHAEEYIEPLECCTILEEDGEKGRRRIKRRMDFGTFVFEDSVLFVTGKSLIISVPALGELPASVFEIHVVTLEPDRQQVRFTYREAQAMTLPERLRAIRQQAWQEKDCKLLRHIAEKFGKNVGKI